MTWVEDLEPNARFRDVEFTIQTDSRRGTGRRAQIHEYADRDEPYVEDLGARAPTFSISVVLVGDDVAEQRGRLNAALNSQGPATLYDTWFGAQTVQVLRVDETTSTKDGRTAHFSIEFTKAGRNQFPERSTGTANEARDAASSALGSIIDAFGKVFDTGGPDFLRSSAAKLAAAAAREMQRVLPQTGGEEQASAKTRRELLVFEAEAGESVRSAKTVAGEIGRLVGELASVSQDPAAALKVLRVVAEFGADLKEIPPITSNRQREQANQAALAGLVRRAAILESAKAAAGMEFESRVEAEALRDELAARLEEEMLEAGETGDGEGFSRLQEARAALVHDITTRGALLARVAEITPSATTPSLVVAYRIHGDALRASEIHRRNRLSHPGFLVGGDPVEVLVSAA